MKRKSHCLQIAVEYLKKGFRNGQFAQGEYLPTVSALASMADVSYYTMWKALKKLHHKGIVSGGTKGKRLRILSTRPLNDAEEPAHETPGAFPENRTPSVKHTWQRLQERIDRDIIQGLFSPGKGLRVRRIGENNYAWLSIHIIYAQNTYVIIVFIIIVIVLIRFESGRKEGCGIAGENAGTSAIVGEK